MTTGSVFLGSWLLTSTAVVAGVEASKAEPWWFVAIVVPLAGFSGGIVWWTLKSQQGRENRRDRVEGARERRREAREDLRVQQAELQTQAMRECVLELQRLRHHQLAHEAALADLPRRLAEVVNERRATG